MGVNLSLFFSWHPGLVHVANFNGPTFFLNEVGCCFLDFFCKTHFSDVLNCWVCSWHEFCAWRLGARALPLLRPFSSLYFLTRPTSWTASGLSMDEITVVFIFFLEWVCPVWFPCFSTSHTFLPLTISLFLFLPVTSRRFPPFRPQPFGFSLRSFDPKGSFRNCLKAGLSFHLRGP